MNELDLMRDFRRLVPGPSLEGEEAARAALLARFRARRRPSLVRRLPVRAVAVAGVSTALALIVAFGLLPGGRGDAPTAAAAETLTRVARVAAAQPAPAALGPGEYFYTKSRGASLSTSDSGGRVWSTLVPITRQLWIARDGSGRLLEKTGEPEFLSAADKRAWEAAGSPPLGANETSDKRFEAGGLFFRDTERLPTEPEELAEVVRARAAGTDVPVNVEMFVVVGDLLRETRTSPELRSALYQVAADIPGIELVGEVKDPVGRIGVAVAVSSDYSGALERRQMIIDPRTGDLLAEEAVLLRGAKFVQAEPGTVIGYTVYLDSGITEAVDARP